MMGRVDVRRAQQEGIRDAIKEIVKEKSKSAQRLNELLAGVQTGPLFKLSTFWPLKFFPVHIAIEKERVVIIFREFMKSGQIISLTCNILQEVAVESGPLFSTLKLTTNKPLEPILAVKYLKKKDAIKACRMIQGLIIACKNDIKLDSGNPKALANKIEELGKIQEAERLVE